MAEKKKIISTISIVGIIIAVVILTVCILLYAKYIIKRSKAKDILFDTVANGTVEDAKIILDEYPTLINETEHSSNFIARISDSSNKTLLLEAIQYHSLNDNKDMIEFLIERGADVNISNGTKPVYPIIGILCRGSDDRYEIAWLMIENGADISVGQQFYTVPYAIVGCKIADGDSPLQEESLKLMKYVVEQGVSMEAPDPTNAQTGDTERYTNYGINSVFGLAARNNHVLVTKYFLDSKMYSVNNIVSNDGTTALIQAVIGESYDTCKLLLEYGADKNIVDDNGKTAYNYAIENGNQQIINLLEQSYNISTNAIVNDSVC